MNITVQYWHWLVFGMILIMAELFVPSFTIFWFGLGGLVVAGLLLLFSDISFTWQLFIWAIASCVFTFLWFKFIRPMMTDRTRAGIAREAAIGETGQVIRAPKDGRRGMVRFTTPLLGSDFRIPETCTSFTLLTSSDISMNKSVLNIGILNGKRTLNIRIRLHT